MLFFLWCDFFFAIYVFLVAIEAIIESWRPNIIEKFQKYVNRMFLVANLTLLTLFVLLMFFPVVKSAPGSYIVLGDKVHSYEEKEKVIAEFEELGAVFGDDYPVRIYVKSPFVGMNTVARKYKLDVVDCELENGAYVYSAHLSIFLNEKGDVLDWLEKAGEIKEKVSAEVKAAFRAYTKGDVGSYDVGLNKFIEEVANGASYVGTVRVSSLEFKENFPDKKLKKITLEEVSDE